jgi:transcription elongation factor/antiterminator RfaH
VTNSGRRWYAVQTQPHREQLAAEQLRQQDFAVFFPQQRKTVRHARRLTQKKVGYFPGYVFVSLDLAADRWRAVNGTYGVKSLVMCGERPAAAPQGFVEALRTHADGEECLAAMDLLNHGDKVVLLTGPFADLVGTLERIEGGQRVRILIDLVGGCVPVLADSYNVARAS